MKNWGAIEEGRKNKRGNSCRNFTNTGARATGFGRFSPGKEKNRIHIEEIQPEDIKRKKRRFLTGRNSPQFALISMFFSPMAIEVISL